MSGAWLFPPPDGRCITDPRLRRRRHPFLPTAGSTVWTGVLHGAAYRLEKPANWNGELVVWAHGYRGTGTTVFVDNSPLRAYYLARGFAWAASSYQANGYDVGQGVRDSHGAMQIARSDGPVQVGTSFPTDPMLPRIP